MSAFAIDTSAFIAILANEPEAKDFGHHIDDNIDAIVSAATLHEAFCIASAERFQDGRSRLARIVDLIEPTVVPFDSEQFAVARDAYARYGRGSGHRAGLNMGDCFAYALARTRDLPLLYKGDDFVHTDIEPAIAPSGSPR